MISGFLALDSNSTADATEEESASVTGGEGIGEG
jgi:hypothetical protein